MSGSNAKKGLHVATLSELYRFEYEGSEWCQLNRDLTYWTLTCMSVDPQNPEVIYAGTEHSGFILLDKRRRHGWNRSVRG